MSEGTRKKKSGAGTFFEIIEKETKTEGEENAGHSPSKDIAFDDKNRPWKGAEN